MNGLEILEKTPIMECSMTYFVVGLLIAIIPTVVIVFIIDKCKRLRGLAYEAIAVILLLILPIKFHVGYVPSGNYEYKVNITKECSLLEFSDKYEIIEKDDDNTYLIRDKVAE